MRLAVGREVGRGSEAEDITNILKRHICMDQEVLDRIHSFFMDEVEDSAPCFLFE